MHQTSNTLVKGLGLEHKDMEHGILLRNWSSSALLSDDIKSHSHCHRLLEMIGIQGGQKRGGCRQGNIKLE